MPFCHSSPFFGQNRIFGRFHLIFGSTVLHFVYVLRSSQKDSKFFKLGQMKYHENLKNLINNQKGLKWVDIFNEVKNG